METQWGHSERKELGRVLFFSEAIEKERLVRQKLQQVEKRMLAEGPGNHRVRIII